MMPSLGKVLFLVENNPYPFDVRVRREAQALRDVGYKVAVICPRQKGQPIFEIRENISIYRFPHPPQGNGLLGYILEFGYATTAMFALTIWVWLRQGFDAIHVANPPDTLFVIGVVFRLFGKRFIFDQHDLAPETYLSRFQKPQTNKVYRALRWLEQCSFRVADIVISTNESYRRVALGRGGKKPEQVFVVRNGPPLSYREVLADSDLSKRAAYIIGYIGTMGPQDGVDYWLRAIREMVYTLNRRDFLAVIIGSGDAAPSLHNLAKELDIEPYVWFTGRISDTDALRYLSTAQICVHPDPLNPLNDKSTMNKMMEYMALGKPVVSFDLTEASYSARGAACYAKPNDVFDFARKVEWLMEHPEARAEMGARGQQRVATTLAWEYSVPSLLQAYESMESQVSDASSIQR
jgi:glycosyltransferase involved in cell wall biosynthesis